MLGTHPSSQAGRQAGRQASKQGGKLKGAHRCASSGGRSPTVTMARCGLYLFAASKAATYPIEGVCIELVRG